LRLFPVGLQIINAFRQITNDQPITEISLFATEIALWNMGVVDGFQSGRFKKIGRVQIMCLTVQEKCSF